MSWQNSMQDNRQITDPRSAISPLRTPGDHLLCRRFSTSDFFPREEIGRVLGELACAENSHALQYAPTEGNHDLRAYLAAKIRCAGSACHIDNIIITNGSQQGLDLLCRILVNPGDPVLVEEPAYVGGMGAIKSYGGVPAGIPMDGEGPLPAAMEKTILKLERQGRHPRLFYTVTNFHNPTGYTTSLARRKAILALAEDYNIVIIEDNPYGELCYEGTVPPNYQALDRSGRVIYLGSYSKIFIPGIRIGWMAAPQAVIEKVCLAKQTADLCSNSLGQRLAYRLSAEGFIDRHVKKLICFYRKNRDAMLETMERCFPPEINFTRPQGGFVGCSSSLLPACARAAPSRPGAGCGLCTAKDFSAAGARCPFSFSQARKNRGRDLPPRQALTGSGKRTPARPPANNALAGSYQSPGEAASAPILRGHDNFDKIKK